MVRADHPREPIAVQRDEGLPGLEIDTANPGVHVALQELPTILERTPYNTSAPGQVTKGKYFARRGYVCVIQDVRGRFESEGEWYAFAREAPDGFDTVEWIAKQPWSDGKVGTLGGSYSGSDQSALIDRALTVPGDLQQWLEREIIDIQQAELVEISVTHQEGEQIVLKKASADDTDFELQKIPQGREVKSNLTVNSIGGGLASLRLDAVVPASDIDWSDAVKISALTADGLQVSAQLVSVEDQYWISLSASAYQEAGSDQPTDAGMETDAFLELTERVNRITDRVTGWAYAIPQYNAEVLTKRMDDLLKPLDTG